MWMDLENIILSEISQTAKASTIWYYLYVESKKNLKTESIYKTETDPHRKTNGYQKGQGGTNEEYGINRYKLLYIK